MTIIAGARRLQKSVPALVQRPAPGGLPARGQERVQTGAEHPVSVRAQEELPRGAEGGVQ